VAFVRKINWNLPAVPADNFAFRFPEFDTHALRPVSFRWCDKSEFSGTPTVGNGFLVEERLPPAIILFETAALSTTVPLKIFTFSDFLKGNHCFRNVILFQNHRNA
jgi:hypothetical protein